MNKVCGLHCIKIKNFNVKLGKDVILEDVNIHIHCGSLTVLIGPNGAGKTTILNTISALKKPTKGEIMYLDSPIHNSNTRTIVSKGISQVPEGRHVFNGMSVMENLEMGAFLRKDTVEVKNDLERIFKSFPVLKERVNQDAQTLSGGEQQMLAMGRALLSNPDLLLLDEPSMGLAPLFIKEIFRIIEEINERGTTVLVVEQNANIALGISDRGYVIETGKIVAEGTGKELLNSDEVQKAYLGG